jgi:hypothetical protein
MKCIDFTPENLFKLGLTPEILKNDFENWLLKNDDFIVDFDSRKIHIGKYDLKRKLNFSLALIRKELTEKGMSDAEIDEYISKMKSNLKPKLDKQLSSLPEEFKKEFLIKTLISNGEKLFKINDEAIKNISDNMFKDDLLINDFETLNQELSKTITANGTETMTFNENLINDPLFNPQSEYQILKSTFKEDYSSRTAHLKDDEDFFLHDLDENFQDWEDTQTEEMNKSFLKLIKELNQKKIFFFGCSFDNYKHNYNNRLTAFLENYLDASEYDFIEDELKFLENILYDIQNSEAAHDGHSQSGYDEFSKAYEFVSITGYKQYFFSHNKKEAFLNEKRSDLIQLASIKENIPANNHIEEVIQEKPKTFELSKKLKKQIRFFKISESEQQEFDRLDAEIEENKKNGVIKNTDTEYSEFKKGKKTPEKWYALLYLLELKVTNTKPPTNYEGSFIKSEIEEIGKQRTGSTGQSFYRECLKINDIINNNSLLERSFGKDWKQKVINLSNNNELIISYLSSLN